MATTSERPMTRQQAHIPPTAACEACRKLKMRCIRPNASTSTKESDEPCDRCRRTNRACNIPTPRPLGRKRGAVGRYHGFEKAYRKMQAELKKARVSTDKASEIQSLSPGRDESEMLDLLRSNIHKIDRGNGDWELPAESRRPGHQNPLSPSSSTINASGPPASEQNQSPYVTTPYAPETITSHVSLEPVSNPLALMAEAAGAAQALETQVGPTDLSPASNFESVSGDGEGIGRYLLHRPGYVSLGLHLDRKVLESGIDALFAPAMESDRYSNYFRSPGANPPRDIGPDLDPVDLGLVSMEEAYALFPVYFSRLHLINGILDPMLHTPGYVRSRSSLLFTWILALTAQFDHASGNLAKRLRLHGEKLSRYVHTCGYKTVEVVQGYYISLLSATPANTLSEERSWLYTMYAFGVAAELGLDQQRRTRYQKESDSCDTQNRSPEGTQSQRLLTFGQRSAVSIQENPETSDGPLLEDQTYLQRLARNRERTWLRILLWERANSAACGRINAFPETELTCNIENWWMHPLADSTDKHTCAFILLRRHLATLQSDIRRQANIPHSNPHWVRDLVDTDFGPWQATWLPSPNTILPRPLKLPDLYLYYVYIHNRLWTLSSALNISANHDRDLYALREDCFDAAIHCCEVTVRDLPVVGEPMYCMLSPTWAMISYAAVLALKLFPYLHGSRPGYEVELLALLAQVALQLKRAGTTPSHRVGIAALLGQHLLIILRARATMLKDAVPTPGEPFTPQHNNGTNPDPGCHLGGNLPNSTASMETLSGTRVNNALVSTYDPLLTTATMSTDTDLGEEGFTDLLREIFGPGFGDVY